MSTSEYDKWRRRRIDWTKYEISTAVPLIIGVFLGKAADIQEDSFAKMFTPGLTFLLEVSFIVLIVIFIFIWVCCWWKMKKIMESAKRKF